MQIKSRTKNFLALTLLFYFAGTIYVFAANVDIKITEKYTNVSAGERLYFNVDIKYPENTSRKDLRLNYEILKDGKIIAQSNNLKAIETQLSFADFIVIPENATDGLYFIKAKVSDYENFNKEVSASFNIVKPAGIQIKGYFLITFIAVIFIGVILFIIQIYTTKKVGRTGRFAPHEYPNLPKRERLFYEIISDLIMQAHYRIGDKALELSGKIDGLIIDKENGRILEINRDPSEIIAMLVLEYERHFGAELKFMPRKIDKEIQEYLKPVNKNLEIINRYFKKNGKQK